MIPSLIGTVSSLIVAILSAVGLPGLFGLMAVESFGVPPVPSEVILPFAGFLVVDGTFSFSAAMIAATLGGLVGSYAAYAVGRWWRHRIVSVGLGRLKLEPRHLERVDRFFARHGQGMVGLSRLVPVIRSYVSYPAGSAKMEPVRFGIYTVIGSIPFTGGLIYAGMLLRSNWAEVATYLRYFDYPLIGLVAVGVGFLALQIAGVLAPGWPPRRLRSSPGRTSVSSGARSRARERSH